ncbi:Multidrug resistance protein ABC Superfamily, partial [Phytophthora palmivora]
MTARPEDPNNPEQSYVEVLTPRLQNEDEKTKILFECDDAPPKRQVPLLELFSFADATDKLLMAVGTVGALGAGVLRPLMVVLWGHLRIGVIRCALEAEWDSFSSSVNKVARDLTIVGVVGLVAGYLQVYCWTLTASRQSKRIRSLYVKAIITQEIGWFDVNDNFRLSSRVAEATITIQDGIGSKMSDMLHFSSTVSFAISGNMAKKVIVAATHNGIQSYAEAGAVAQESLSNIRTVHMFNSVQYFVQKYSTALEGTTNAGIKKALAVGWGSGLMYMMVFLMYALGFFLGAVFVARDNLDGNTCDGSDCYDGGRVLTVLVPIMQGAMALGQAGTNLQAVYSACAAAFDVFELVKRPLLIDPTDDNQGKELEHVSGDIDIDNIWIKLHAGAMALGQAGPNLQAVYSACAAAFDVFELVKRPLLIDPTDDNQGKELEHVSGDIDIDNVRFAYPSRPEVEVCRNYSLKIKAGETVALVGPSGSGKSTVISLLERFYDPLEGSVKVDGEDIRTLNVKWLRQQIGLVGQEPVLFATSIMENIRHGRPSASDNEVMDAAKMANAFNFITEFPEGFDT